MREQTTDVRGKIEAVAFGGEGILRADGLVVFVPYTARGDEVAVALTERKKSFARAKLVTLLEPSKLRVAPACPHFGVCGGCQLQHVNYEEQLALKHDFVKQALARIAKADAPVGAVVGAVDQWNYRRVVKLGFTWSDGELLLGYVNATSNGLAKVSTCPIFSDDTALFESLNVYMTKAFASANHLSGTLSLFRAREKKFVGWIDVDGDLSKELCSSLEALPEQLKGLVLTARNKRLAVGDVELAFSQDGCDFTYTPQSFVQNHAEQSAKINRRILEAVKSTGAKTVFDLYCGFGVTAITLAKAGIHVSGVEGNAESIRLAHLNADTNGVKVEWICDDVGAFLGRARKRAAPDAIIVNPPRTGLSPKVVNALAEHKAHQLIYISCMPQTLARDLVTLLAAGYEIASCQPYDMFPQTTHVETMIVLKHLRAA